MRCAKQRSDPPGQTRHDTPGAWDSSITINWRLPALLLCWPFLAIVLTMRRLRRVATVVVTCFVVVCTIFLWILGELLSEAEVVPPPIGAWLSLIVLVHASLLLIALKPQGRILTRTRA